MYMYVHVSVSLKGLYVLNNYEYALIRNILMAWLLGPLWHRDRTI